MRVQRTVWNTVVEEKTKNRASKNPVQLVPILQKWLLAHRSNAPDEAFVFAGPKFGRSLNLANLARRVIVPMLQQNGVNYWSGWHGFRRGLGTILHGIGTPPKTIQTILRHASIKTTMDVYVKPDAEGSQLAMKRLEKVFKVVRKSVRNENRRKSLKPA